MCFIIPQKSQIRYTKELYATPMNILILTSRTGGGHVSLAEALQDLFTKEILVNGKGDVKSSARPIITIADPQPPIFHQHYRIVSRHALWLWAAEFQFLNTPKRAFFAHHIFTVLVQHRLHELLDSIQPDLILTTYPFLTYEVMQVLQKCSSTVPLVSLFSDANDVHAAWLTEHEAAATLAPTHETYKQALAAGFIPERLHLVGWPVRTQFARAAQSSNETHNTLLAQLNLAPDRFTIFLQGGGEGAAHVDRTIENIQAVDNFLRKAQIILAVGTNRVLHERYKHIRNLSVLPYTKEIAPWMAVADVIMGKAGPNMLFESVTLGKPFVATSYIPGQEFANLALIKRYGLGWIALHDQEQRALLTSLIHNSELLHTMSATINAYRLWNIEANAQVGPLIRSFLTRLS